jgi:hypothetical protein
MKLRWSTLACAVVIGCGGGSGAPPKTSATIGPLGGVVQVPGGPTLNIVPNALSIDTLIAVQARSSAPAGALSTVYDFKPEGLSLARPATVSMPIDPSVEAASVFWSKPNSTTDFESAPAMVANGVASTTISRFGSGYAGPAQGLTRTVSGTIATVYWADDGTKTTRPGTLGLGMTVPAIWVPAGRNYRRVPVSFGADWSFSVQNVPEGPYFLEVDTKWDATTTWAQLVELTTSSPDLSTVVTARPDVEIETRQTDFTLDIAGLTPWVNPSAGFTGDMLLFAGSQAHIYGRPQVAMPPPVAGATSWHATYDWKRMSSAQAIALPDASKGDVEFVYQRSTSSIGSGATQGMAHVATRFLRLDNLTLHDGVPGSASVTLADAPQTGALRANLRNSRWAALLADANPATKPWGNQGVSVLAIPRSLEFPDQPGLVAGTSLVWIQGPPLSDLDYGTVRYGQFLGPGWKETRYVLYQATADVPVPGSATPYTAWPTFMSFEAMLADDDIVPVLGPPRSPRIEGRDAFQAQTGVGFRPTISWSPPRLGAATSYVVRVDAVGGSSAQFASVSMTVYGVTSMQVPDGLLTLGAQYAVTITSVSAPWDKLDRPPFRTGMPYSASDCVTAVFSP